MGKTSDLLYHLAHEHSGVFTAGEASQAGVRLPALVQAASRGIIQPLSRGIYRYVRYPVDEQIAQLWEAVLWPTLRRGTVPTAALSHLTALAEHYRAIEYTPPRVSITIPSTIRIRRTTPAWLEIHSADLPPDEVESARAGLPVTSLARTIVDCLATNVDRRWLRNAIDASLEGRSEMRTPDSAALSQLRELVG